jgi:filamentous hemagglutinin family protein
MYLKRYLVLLGLTLLSLGTMPERVRSQIVPETGPTGTGTIVTPNVQSPSQIDITGGTTAGTNLFHGFKEFGVDQGQTANFVTNANIQNILARVSGGNPSIINGILQVSGGNANLYLMNPAGILFGSGASLNVPGSFVATTANGMRFGDNGWFSAVGANSYGALTGSPRELAFTMPNPGSIVNAGNLSVLSGQSIALAGGVVINTGTITTPGGKISIQAVPGQGQVVLREEGKVLGFSFNTLGNNLPVNPLAFTPVQLPQLLTGGGATVGATGVTVAADGTIRLTSSGYVFKNQLGTAIISNDVSADGAKAGTVAVYGKVVELASANVNGTDITLGATESVKVQLSTFSKPNALSGSKGTINIIPRDDRSDSTLGVDNFDIAQPLNTGGRDLNVRAKQITVGDILSEGGDVNFQGSVVLGKNALFDAGSGSISLSNVNSSSTEAFRSLRILAPTKSVRLGNIGDSVPLQSLTVDANSISLSNITTFGDIEINSSQSIDITGAFIKALVGGNISIATPQSINTLNANFIGKDIRLTAGDTVDIRDQTGNRGISFESDSNLYIQGDKAIRVLAQNNPLSIFVSGSDTVLTSDGVIAALGKFNASGRFTVQTLSGQPGDISGTSENTLISSVGDIEFGNYEGLALKVESKGSIKAGNILIIRANSDLTGNDPDIKILRESPSVILRAGVQELQNLVNIPNVKVGGTNFNVKPTSTSPATIVVGKIVTSALDKGGEVRLSAPGDITTSDIFTEPIRPLIQTTTKNQPSGGLIEINSTSGKVLFENINTRGGNVSIVGSSISGKNISAGAPGSFFFQTPNYLNLGKVALQSTLDNIEVESIYSGPGPLNIDASQLFKVTGVVQRISSVVGATSSYLNAVEAEIRLKDSSELIDFFVKERGFDRKILESSDATIKITRRGAFDGVIDADFLEKGRLFSTFFPTSIAVELPGKITIKHGGSESANFKSESIEIVGKKGGQSGLIIGPTRVEKGDVKFFETFKGDIQRFDPSNPQSTITLSRNFESQALSQQPENSSLVVGTIVVGAFSNGLVSDSVQNVAVNSLPKPESPKPEPPKLEPPKPESPKPEPPKPEPPKDTDRQIVRKADSSICKPPSQTGSQQSAKPPANSAPCAPAGNDGVILKLLDDKQAATPRPAPPETMPVRN